MERSEYELEHFASIVKVFIMETDSGIPEDSVSGKHSLRHYF